MAPAKTINVCRALTNPCFPEQITVHEDFNIEYLKAPIGSNEFVAEWLQDKLLDLHKATQLVCAMECKHEAGTLLRSCAAVCRVVYLMRTVPPKQIAAFISEFDSILQLAFETLLESDISAKVWDIAKLPPEYGGMGWKTGLQTFGAHYLTSIAKNATPIDNIVPAWDVASEARQDVGEWLALHTPCRHWPRPRGHGGENKEGWSCNRSPF